MANTAGEKELKTNWPIMAPSYDNEILTTADGANDPSVTEGGMELTMVADTYLASLTNYTTSTYTSVALSGTTEGAMASATVTGHAAAFAVPQKLVAGRVYRLSFTGGDSGYESKDISELGTKTIFILTARYFNDTRQVFDYLMDVTSLTFRPPTGSMKYTGRTMNLLPEGHLGIKSRVLARNRKGLD